MTTTESENRQPGLGILYGFMAIVGLVLLLLLPIATELGPADQGWWTQPYLMPALSLILVTLPAAFLLFQHRRQSKPPTQTTLRAELVQWVKPVEFFVYYILYIVLLGIVGYFLSSLIFIAGLSFRVGLKGRKWMLASFLFALALVALFRWGLGVWVPSAALYELFPRDIRIFLIRNF